MATAAIAAKKRGLRKDMAQDSGLRTQGSGLRTQGSGLRAHGSGLMAVRLNGLSRLSLEP
jgi:hypothetical protein